MVSGALHPTEGNLLSNLRHFRSLLREESSALILWVLEDVPRLHGGQPIGCGIGSCPLLDTYSCALPFNETRPATVLRIFYTLGAKDSIQIAA